jgi:hypothetical protein
MVAPADTADTVRTEVVYAAEERALKKLVDFLGSEHPDIALKGAEVIAKYAAERRRNETRLAVEKMRAETARAKIPARRGVCEEEEEWVPPPEPPPKPPHLTPEGRAAARERSGLEAATTPDPLVLLWGGGHPLLVGRPPDAADARVFLHKDCSVTVDGHWPIYWVVSEAAHLASGRGERPIQPADFGAPAAGPGGDFGSGERGKADAPDRLLRLP